MARVTYVKSAQQRYATKAILNDDGTPRRVPVMRRDGTPKTDKRGRAITMAATERDLTQPKPLARCDYPGCKHPDHIIQVGQSYKWIKPKSGPCGGRLMARHGEHPTWQRWEYSSSLSAQAERVAYDAENALADVETQEDAQAVLEQAASEIRDDLAQQRRDSAENMREGFGHDTYQSEQLDSDADELESWADEVEGVDLPDPEGEDYAQECLTCDGEGSVSDDCDACQGTGQVDVEVEGSEVQNEAYCDACQGTGQVETTCGDCDGEGHDGYDLDAWREAVQEAAGSVLGSCPI